MPKTIKEIQAETKVMQANTKAIHKATAAKIGPKYLLTGTTKDRVDFYNARFESLLVDLGSEVDPKGKKIFLDTSKMMSGFMDVMDALTGTENRLTKDL